MEAQTKLKQASTWLGKARKKDGITPTGVQNEVLSRVQPIIPTECWIPKKGKNADVVSAVLPASVASAQDAIVYYIDLLKLAGVRRLVAQFAFGKMADKFDYLYPVYRVEEVGYKLSKRREKMRPNQLCKFVNVTSGQECPNLHLANGKLRTEVTTSSPERVLDYIKRDITWR